MTVILVQDCNTSARYCYVDVLIIMNNGGRCNFKRHSKKNQRKIKEKQNE